MAFESLPGIKVKNSAAKRTYIIADYFSVYEKKGEVPEIFNWSDFKSIAETKDEFVFSTETRTFTIPMKAIPSVTARLQIRAVVEGAVAANPDIDYTYGRRILPPKSLCSGCEIPSEAYVASGEYNESEINNANVVLKNADHDRLIWIFAPIAAIGAFILQWLTMGDSIGAGNDVWIAARFLAISALAGLFVGIAAYLFCAYMAKTLYRKIAAEDPAIGQEISFVVCEEGFMAAESLIYNYADIIRWYNVAYFMETNHMYIIFSRDRAVCWLPKRLFPKEIHQELGDFIASKLLHKPVDTARKAKYGKRPAKAKQQG